VRWSALQDQLQRLAKRSGRTLDDVTELWTERAAIRQHDGGARKVDAERDALDDVANNILRTANR
jgi:hypothetical protein